MFKSVNRIKLYIKINKIKNEAVISSLNDHDQLDNLVF